MARGLESAPSVGDAGAVRPNDANLEHSLEEASSLSIDWGLLTGNSVRCMPSLNGCSMTPIAEERW